MGAGGAIAFVLSSSVKSPISGLAISNRLRLGLAMVAKELADELGPGGIRVPGLLPGREVRHVHDHMAACADRPLDRGHVRRAARELTRFSGVRYEHPPGGT